MRPGGAAGSAVAAVGLADALPSVAAARWVRLAVAPRLAGVGRPDHVALTVDDGPDPRSTPAWLEALAGLDVRATFFLLGERLARHPGLGTRLVDSGHEVAVHGWRHRPHLVTTPLAVAADLRRALACIREVTGATPRFWRPPHGIPTTTGLLTAHRAGLQPVLWTADGRDWATSADGASVAHRIARQLQGGGVVLLHDGAGPDGHSTAALAALPDIIATARRHDLVTGPLGDHGIRRPSR